jgi:AraC-like DNA-binding protein
VEVVHVGRSAGTLHQGGQTHRYASGGVFLYQPGSVHWVAATRRGEHTCLGVVGTAAAALPPRLWAGSSALDRLFAECRRAIAGRDESRQRRLDHLVSLIALELAETPPLAALAPLPPAQRAKAIIDAEPARTLSLAELGQLVGVSAEHLRHVFRRAHGVGIARYRQRCRIAAARAALERGVSVADAAAAGGFADAFYFSRVFARAHGMPPSAWQATPRRHASR